MSTDNTETSIEQSTIPQGRVLAFVSALGRVTANAFRPIYLVTYVCNTRYGQMYGWSHVDLNGRFGRHSKALSKEIAAGVEGATDYHVAFTSVQRLGYKVFGHEVFTW